MPPTTASRSSTTRPSAVSRGRPRAGLEIKEAYETLSDRQRRMAYDRQLSQGARRRGRRPRDHAACMAHEPLHAHRRRHRARRRRARRARARVRLGGDDEPAAVTQPTITIASSPTATPEGQTPRPTPPPNPPEVAAETVTTPSGLQYIDIQPGTGATPALGQTVRVEYAGWLKSDGTSFDSSYNRGEPTEFRSARTGHRGLERRLLHDAGRR